MPSISSNPAYSPRILSVSDNESLRNVRQMLLERAGYNVTSVSDFKQLEAAAGQQRYDLVIIGHSLAPKIKLAIATFLRDRTPGTPILELCLYSPDIQNAEFTLSPEPGDLLAKVADIFARRDGRSLKAQ